jgi:UDP-N-acetylmuramoyl-tripeptide--D-alanyl-D-alanine ligase
MTLDIITMLSPLLLNLALAAFCYRRLARYLHFFQQEEYDALRFIMWWLRGRAFDTRATGALLVPLVLYSIADITSHEFLDALASNIQLFILPLVVVLLARAEENPATNGKKPLVWTARAKRIFAIAFIPVAVVLAIIGTLPDRLHQAAIAIFTVQALPLLLAVTTLLLAPYEKYVQASFYRQAVQKLKYLNPTIIGITGSFGKTSTKTILAHILSSVAPTLATPGSVNTVMGNTRIIREQLKPEHRFFIVEMGAYGPGSIERLCALTPPTLTAITAIGAAHYERYKTIDQVAKAKFAISTAAWQSGGVTVLNTTQIDDRYLTQYVAEPARTRLISYHSRAGGFTISTVQSTPTGISFRVQMPDGLMVDFQTPLFGAHHVTNCVVAIVLALECGVPLATIQMALTTTPQTKHRLEVKRDGLPYTMIDDAYNSNAVGFAAALDVLDMLARHQNGRRILITPGMTEMGALHDSEHERLGRLAAQKADWIIAVAPHRIPTFVDGARSGSARVDEVPTLAAARALIDGVTTPIDVILFENDLPDLYESRPRF